MAYFIGNLIKQRSVGAARSLLKQAGATKRPWDDLPIITKPACYNKDLKKIKRSIAFENSRAPKRAHPASH